MRDIIFKNCNDVDIKNVYDALILLKNEKKFLEEEIDTKNIDRLIDILKNDFASILLIEDF